MNQTSKAENRRANRRCRTKFETLVYNDEIFGQLVDISEGGLAFAYPKNQSRPKDMFFDLNIYCNNRDVHIKDLKCKIISETKLPQHAVDAEDPVHRQSIQFDGLTPEQQAQLLELIRHADNLQEKLNNSTQL